MPGAPRSLAAVVAVVLQLMLLGRGTCPPVGMPSAENGFERASSPVSAPASDAHAHHGGAPEPASKDTPDTPDTPHDGAGCFMMSACGTGGMHEAAIVPGAADAPSVAFPTFDAFALVIATPSPEPPPPRA